MCCGTQYSSGCHYSFGSPPPTLLMRHLNVFVCFPKQSDAKRGHRVLKNIANYCILVLLYVTRPWALLWLLQLSSSSSAVVIEIADRLPLPLPPSFAPRLSRIARSFLSNPLPRLQSAACSSDVSHKKQSRYPRRWSEREFSSV